MFLKLLKALKKSKLIVFILCCMSISLDKRLISLKVIIKNVIIYLIISIISIQQKKIIYNLLLLLLLLTLQNIKAHCMHTYPINLSYLAVIRLGDKGNKVL